jgi:hypothetical protein
VGRSGDNQSRFWTRALLGIVLGASSLAAQDAPDGPFLVRGRAVYEKVPVGPLGLDPELRTLRPVRDAIVQAVDAVGALVAASATGPDGAFTLVVPAEGEYGVRVLAALGSGEAEVRDNLDGDAVWSVDTRAMAGETVELVATDGSRVAGAFNILDVVRRADAFVRSLEPEVAFPVLTVYWSPGNTRDPMVSGDRRVRGTYFDPRRDTAVVLGDRQFDSDEFDDDVLLHEYGHYLSRRLSGDTPPGGPHRPGDVLDPRVAWSEGWANYFSALVDGDSIYRDSSGEAGRSLLEYDLESNLPATGVPGYWSERTVHALLWDLTDGPADSGDSLQVPLSAIWAAFRSLADDAFVYLPTFLDRLYETGAVTRGELEQLARLHALDYVVSDQGRVPTFPRWLDGDTASGELDSWSTRRVNLARSAHLYSFSTSGGGVTIELEITGLGSGRNPQANDLDLYLMDAGGEVRRASNTSGDGQTESIVTFLPEGSYVIEVRSYSRRSEDGRFNSGTYRLRISRP